MPRYSDILLFIPHGAFTQVKNLECIKLIPPTSILDTPLTQLKHNRRVFSHSLYRGPEKSQFRVSQ